MFVCIEKKRIADNPHFIIIDENAKWLKQGRDNSLVNLNYEKYKKELEQREKESKAFDDIALYESNLTFNSPSYEIPMMEQDSILAKKREIWHKNLKKDMKKGRTLIRNLEESKSRFKKVAEAPMERKGPYMPVDFVKKRAATRTSIFKNDNHF